MFKHFKFILPVFFLVFAQPGIAQNRNILWYDKPAANWNEALPIGNGYTGAMIFGDPQHEQLQINESTIWGGGPNNTVDTAAAGYIKAVRMLLNEKKYVEAQELASKHLGPKGNSGMPYQLAGNLFINFTEQGNVTNYRRDLNIENATAQINYTQNGIHFKREYFTSFTNNILVVRLTASKPAQINCKVTLQSPLEEKITAAKNEIVLSGKGSDHENQKAKVKFNMITRVKIASGTIKADSSGLQIMHADTAVIYLAVATNFRNYHDLSANPYQKADSILNQGFKKDFQTLQRANIAFYKKYYDRVKLDLGNSEAAKNPTDVRIKNFADGKDPQLAELYFQFGRYLLICASQPDSQPANLQGIWNGELKGPWDSKYTVNINTEMNYWPSEVTNLPELSKPLFNMITDLSVTGKETASKMYGARGWMLHHNTDIWRITGVVDGAFWGLWPTASAWLCHHLWEHYLYTGDKKFLQQYYQTIKSATHYYVDVLQTEPQHQWLVISPSVSPEHEYIPGRNGVSVTAGATMDNQLVYGLFTEFAQAAAVLYMDKAYADTILQYRNRLPPMQIGKYGQLQEWLEDWDSPTDKHRHVSHLYGLFPGNQISPFRDPQLFAAVKNSLIYRGDVSTGWSMAWKINLWARLLDGNHAYKLIRDQISPVNSFKAESGGSYPNLFDAHPPFQIDGNYGCTSGIAEMLLQSHDGAIYMLPALPDDWPKGSITGLAARGGFKVDMAWDGGRITHLVIHSAMGGNCRIRLNAPLKNSMLKAASGTNSNLLYKVYNLPNPIIKPNDKDLNIKLPANWLYDFKTQAGKTYTIL